MMAKKIFIAASNLVIALVLVQTWLKPFPDMILSGVEKPLGLPAPSFSGILGGKFQEAVETRLRHTLGFRGFLVKSDNQIKYSFFSEFSQNHPRMIILGKEKYLYQENYLNMYNRISVVRGDEMEKKAAALKKLQDELKRRNVGFLLVISPSKTTIYPEYIPERFILRGNLSRPDNYRVLSPLLERHGVNVLDGRKIFLDLKRRSTPNLFPTSGIHWSLYACCLFTDRLIRRMEDLTGKRLVRFAWGEPLKSREPIELDKDLARLVNILFTRSLFTGYLYVKTVRDAPPGARRPNILMVGSSFCWNIIEYLDRNSTCSAIDFFYYYNTRYVYPGKSRQAIDRPGIDWEREIRSRDMVVIEVNEAAMGETGFGFVEDCTAALGR
jgi:hypothetical protein